MWDFGPVSENTTSRDLALGVNAIDNRANTPNRGSEGDWRPKKEKKIGDG
jgi:hypothetical protein